MQLRPIIDEAHTPLRTGLRMLLTALRWTFIAIGAMASAVVMFVCIYRADARIYDPSLFATGLGGLFSMGCGVMLMLLTRNRRLHAELRRIRTRCEALADSAWELREAEARAVSLVEAQGDVIVRRDNAGRITYANDAYCALAGQSREALLGTVQALPSLEQGSARALPDGTRLRDERVSAATGPRWLAWREVVVWADKAECAEVQSVGRDVTERVEAERALAEARDAAESANRAKSRFLAMVSHEIRTPLNGILGMTELLRDTPLTPEQANYVKAARTSGEALLSLIDDILDFSKIEAGKLELRAEPFALTALLEEVVELLSPRAQAKGLDIGSDVDERLPARRLGDAARLRQVLLNLAGNAIKFTERGGVSLKAAGGATPDEIVFEVHDSGIGIAPEQQARVFDEFEQADNGPARRFGGTGLGLAISRRIVEEMDGRIAVDSAPGQGSTFRVAIRLPPVGGDEFTAPDLGGWNVLAIGGGHMADALIKRRLTRWGANVACAPVGLAADLLTQRWDAILVDHSIGAAAAETLVQAAVAVERRIALITPGERFALPALKAAGFTGYLVKPIRAASLKAQLAPGPAAAAEPEPAASERSRAGRSLSILVAEDNEINALLIRTLLSRLGHRPTMADNGDGALAHWQRALAAGAPFDLVLMDLHMPGLDGLEAARRIRAREAEGDARRTPILALTANASAEDRDACLAAGMDGFLVKPLDRERLAAALSPFTDQSAAAA